MSVKNIIDYFEIIDTEEKAYWLGFLCADGYVAANEDKIELTLAEKDLAHLEKYKASLNLTNKICYRSATKAYRISFRSQKCKSDLIKLGCIPQKSLKLEFPSDKQVPLNLIRHFCRGYFDGDGCICNTDNTFSLSFIGTENFINGFLNVAPQSMYKNNKITNVHRKGGAKRYMLSAQEDAIIFLNWLYKDSSIYLDRKYELYLDFINNGIKKNKCRLLEDLNKI